MQDEFLIYENKIKHHMYSYVDNTDPSHDILHIERVVQLAKKIAISEKAKLEIVVPAIWMHDYINFPKDHPERNKASLYSAEKAIEFLKSIQYPEQYYSQIYDAILGHSFSANITITSIEAKVVQDADRLDAIGAIGIARVFTVAGLLKRPYYNAEDVLAANRSLNDLQYTLDHFFVKLLNIQDKLQTQTAKEIGYKRTEFLKKYLEELKNEIM